MPRISTDNYDTIAAWNGSQDLFVVEQPDGTKVATPAMVKQFMEAGDFEATGEVKDGHGNILKNMAKSADVNEVIGDLSQTGLTGDSVAAQLGTAKGQISDINDKVRGVFKSQVADFNDLPNGSIMQVYGSAAHAPGASIHYYIVFTYFIAGTTTYKLQIAIENIVGSIYTRDCSNGVWGSWNKFATT